MKQTQEACLFEVSELVVGAEIDAAVQTNSLDLMMAGSRYCKFNIYIFIYLYNIYQKKF